MNRPHRIAYFGKIPARSDFIKAAADVPLMGVLDEWLAQVMSLLAADPRWKINYDAMAPINFAFVGPRRRHAIAGHIVASSDQSGRRYPFLTMRTLDVAEPAPFVARSPQILGALWSRMETIARDVLAASEPADQLHAIGDTMVELDQDSDAAFADFLCAHSVASLAGMLARAETRRLILALGILLQPVLRSGASRLEKSLVLPLPVNPHQRYLAATFWLDLIAPFLAGADFELGLFITRLDNEPVLVLGFCGASAQTLHAIIDPHTGKKRQVCFGDLAWVEQRIGSDTDIRRLASYLDQPQLPLQAARELFRQVFLGA